MLLPPVYNVPSMSDPRPPTSTAMEPKRDPSTCTPPGRFDLVTDLGLFHEPVREHLIADFIPSAAFGVLFGGAGASKTFLMLDVGMSVCTGTPWQGRATRRGLVVIVAAEGQEGLKARIAAWKKAHGYPLSDFAGLVIIREAVNPLDEKEMADLVAQLRALPESPVLVAVDTWGLCLSKAGADEKDNAAAARAARAWKVICAELRTSLVVIHHEGHEHKGPLRGACSLHDNADFEFGMTALKGGVIRLRNTKARDAAPCAPMHFRRTVVSPSQPR
jgi:hypothetical protein